jgi:hypothetical protein
MDYSVVRKVLIDCFKFDSIDYERAEVLTLAYDTDRSFLYQGKYYSPLVDTPQDDLETRGTHCVSVSRIISTIKGGLSHGNARAPEGRFARALITKRLKGVLQRGRYPFSGMEESIWADILDVTGAKKVIGMQPSRELCAAAHKRGVWVADVQHGVVAEQHPWYGEEFRAAEPREQLPDAFLCWDRGSERVTNVWAKARGIDTIPIGNRWLARFLRPDPHDQLANDVLGKYARDAARLPNRRKTILVSLSWGEYTIPNGFIIDALERVIRKTSGEYLWLIRLHPNQLKGFATQEKARFVRYFESALQGHADWEVATKYPLPVILKHVDMHISWSSSVCIEAAQSGVKSALMDARLKLPIYDRYYEYYRGIGMVQMIEPTEADLDAWIARNSISRLPPEDYTEFDRAYSKLIEFLATPGSASNPQAILS